MRAEIVTVGTELLLGQIVDTNSAWIAEQFAANGVHVHYQTKVGDNHDRMIEVFTNAIGRADFVVVTGGLGPTQDDITREALSEVTGRTLSRDEEIADRIREMFGSRGRHMSDTNLRQADVPEGAEVISQRIGTAPGLIVPMRHDAAERVFYAVPGVPVEMKEMIERSVVPDILDRMRRRSGTAETIRSRMVKCWGVTESQLAELLHDRFETLNASETTTLAFLAGGGVIRVRITARAPDAAAVEKLLDAEEVQVRRTIGEFVFGTDDETLESAVVDRLRASGRSLAAAESMTGGLVGETVTRVPGSSDVFLGSAVTYAVAAKRDLLGVPAELLDEHGPVSEPVAAAMASGARKLFGSDIAISVTGSAGPETQDSRVGETYLGVDFEGDVFVVRVVFPGTRDQVRMYATSTLLDLVRRRLGETGPGGATYQARATT